MDRPNQPEVQVLAAEGAWARNASRQVGLAVMVLAIVISHWATAFAVALIGVVAVTAVLMRIASTRQVRRFRKDRGHAPATQNGIAGQLVMDARGIEWLPRKAKPRSAEPFDVRWSRVRKVTLQPLTGVVVACRVVVDAGSQSTFVVSAPTSEFAAHVEEVVARSEPYWC